MDIESIVDTTKTGILWITAGGITYLTAMVALQSLEFIPGLAKRIPPDEVDRVVGEEAKKLDLNPDDIDARAGVFLKHANASSGKKPSGGYHVSFTSKNPSIHAIRHELYHIKSGDCDLEGGIGNNLLYYFFVAEPRATLYEVFKIKL